MSECGCQLIPSVYLGLLREMMHHCPRHSEAVVAALHVEVGRLWEAVRKYGNHLAGCRENNRLEHCVCGFDAILDTTHTPTEGKNE